MIVLAKISVINGVVFFAFTGQSKKTARSTVGVACT